MSNILNGCSTPEDILIEIDRFLPSYCKLTERVEDGLFVCEISDSTQLLWRESHVDERLLLLNAYGWVYQRSNIQRSPFWTRGTPTLPVISQALPKVVSQNDPEAIASVYENQDENED